MQDWRFRDWFALGAILALLMAVVRWPAGLACAGCLVPGSLVLLPPVVIIVLARNPAWFLFVALTVTAIVGLVLLARRKDEAA